MGRFARDASTRDYARVEAVGVTGTGGEIVRDDGWTVCRTIDDGSQRKVELKLF